MLARIATLAVVSQLSRLWSDRVPDVVHINIIKDFVVGTGSPGTGLGVFVLYQRLWVYLPVKTQIHFLYFLS